MIKIKNIPTCILTTQDIENWVDSGIRFFQNRLSIAPNNIQDIIIGDEEYTLTVTFSDKIYKSPYHVKDINDIKKEILKNWPFIQDIIKLESYYFTSGEDGLMALADHISSRSDRRYSFDEVLNKLKKIVGNAPLIKSRGGTLLLGRYYKNKDEIVLYTNAIATMATFNKPLKQCIEEVFIHELFHNYHYFEALSNSEEISLRHDYTSTVVKESLAAYMEYQYCIYKGIECDINLDWDSCDVVSYPYSGAKEIESFTHFRDIFVESFDNMDKALRVLLYKNQDSFYNIKNKK